MIEIEIGGVRFKIHEGEWSGKPRTFHKTLKSVDRSMRVLENVIYDPDKDKTTAELVTRALGGKVVDISQHKPEPYDPDVVY